MALVRNQGIFPAPEELVSPFAKAHFVGGDARGSHVMPLMPEPINTPVAVHLATAGLGAVLVPAANVPLELADTARPLDPPITWELTAFTRSVLSTPAAAFVELLRDREWLSLPPHAIVLPGS